MVRKLLTTGHLGQENTRPPGQSGFRQTHGRWRLAVLMLQDRPTWRVTCSLAIMGLATHTSLTNNDLTFQCEQNICIKNSGCQHLFDNLKFKRSELKIRTA